MEKIEALKTIVSTLMKTDANTVVESTVLAGLLSSSIGRARLDATLRSQLGITSAEVYTVQTFGELCRIAGTEGAEHSIAAPASSTTPLMPDFSGTCLTVGIDIQAVADLPIEPDYWDADFYRQHFTQQEIAYALLQPKPRDSFAAAWCAKEALRKADNRWIAIDWKLTEIIRDRSGRPSLRSGDKTIPCSVSVSHTNGFALAVVAFAEIAVPSTSSVPADPALATECTGNRSKSPLVISIIALLISLAAAACILFR